MEWFDGKISGYVHTILSMQANAGANALQILIPGWGAVNSAEYEQAIFPHMKRIISTIKLDSPYLPLP